MVYRCWTVKCKTEDCGVCLTLDVIGQDEKYEPTLLPPLDPFSVTCCECNAAHTYTVADVEEQKVKNPSLTKPCIAFLNAVAKGIWPDSDTAGFSDADGNAVAGVFWHSAGYILDKYGNKRGIEPDPPGWYYWYEGPDKFRYLQGPWTTMADANFYLDAKTS